MLATINELEPGAWAGLAGIVTAVVAALVARRGAKRSPPEVGHEPPDTDRTEYVLKEVRGVQQRLESLDERVVEIDRRTEKIHGDTRVLVDRR
ncbi:hypothetical protein [Salipiger mucosus]|uniref:Uncharacterized protein n=1 Tax=Salipiger mucosus DSM 16094 TaxID=1123237 RepID=S9RVU5_9RHOB|nr:hypothetical protein [Salipiger mucosus]EPX82110.1 hypothetical protein Salmuc_02478 [Salipiger mucosus DSM 16094]